jgi:hypothetical protein
MLDLLGRGGAKGDRDSAGETARIEIVFCGVSDDLTPSYGSPPGVDRLDERHLCQVFVG